MIKFFFRLALLALGAYLLYAFGGYASKTIWYRATGEVVTGRISGFLVGRYSPSVQQENSGVRNGRRRARRPVFQYPIAVGSTDSLEGRSSVAVLSRLSQYELSEPVTVVFAKGKPTDAYLFGTQLILMNILLSLFAIYMMSMGIRGKA